MNYEQKSSAYDSSSDDDLTDIYNHNGIDYYRDKDGILYDMKTFENCYVISSKTNEIKSLKKETKKNIKKVIIEEKNDDDDDDSDCEIFYEEDLINEYKNSFTDVEKIVNDIAEKNLDDTYSINNSVGYLNWLKNVKLID